jgi:hypothetical protein
MVLFSRKAYILDLGSSRFSGVARRKGLVPIDCVPLRTYSPLLCGGASVCKRNIKL